MLFLLIWPLCYSTWSPGSDIPIKLMIHAFERKLNLCRNIPLLFINIHGYIWKD